eukprot:6151775-Lingulodinium_polyedra.AAC.1
MLLVLLTRCRATVRQHLLVLPFLQCSSYLTIKGAGVAAFYIVLSSARTPSGIKTAKNGSS